jgi:hypothetical protein
MLLSNLRLFWTKVQARSNMGCNFKDRPFTDGTSTTAAAKSDKESFMMTSFILFVVDTGSGSVSVSEDQREAKMQLSNRMLVVSCAYACIISMVPSENNLTYCFCRKPK